MTDLFAAALTRLETAAKYVRIEPEVIEKLKYPKETLSARLMVRMDDGTRRSFQAWRCRYDDTRGPTKGGIRFHPSATMEETMTLAFWMTFKCAVANLPYGGGKGAVQVDPRELSRSELERLSRAYVQAFASLIGPDRDIPAPDVYTNALIMGWMADEYATIVREPCPAVITGKPIALGGSLGRDDATARGGYYLLRALKEELGLPEKPRVAIQGFGNAGQHIARFLDADGWRIVAVSDSRNAVHRPDGINYDTLMSVKASGASVGTLAGQAGIERLDPEALVGVDCDLLVPAALEDMVHDGNAGSVKAQVILELANGPLTPAADAIVAQRGIKVIPDILANAGGVTVSYFEWVQNRQGFYWSLEEVHQRLNTIMAAEGRKVWDLSQTHGVPLRTAAYIHGLGRLSSAIEAHGTSTYFAG